MRKNNFLFISHYNSIRDVIRINIKSIYMIMVWTIVNSGIANLFAFAYFIFEYIYIFVVFI